MKLKKQLGRAKARIQRSLRSHGNDQAAPSPRRRLVAAVAVACGLSATALMPSAGAANAVPVAAGAFFYVYACDGEFHGADSFLRDSHGPVVGLLVGSGVATIVAAL